MISLNPDGDFLRKFVLLYFFNFFSNLSRFLSLSIFSIRDFGVEVSLKTLISLYCVVII